MGPWRPHALFMQTWHETQAELPKTTEHDECRSHGVVSLSWWIPWSVLSILMCETKDHFELENQTRKLLENSTTHRGRSSRPDAGVVFLAESQRPTGRR